MKPLFSDAKVVQPDQLMVKEAPPTYSTLTPLDQTSANALAPVTPAAVSTGSEARAAVPAPRMNEQQIADLGKQAATSLAGISTEILKGVRASDTGEFGKDLNSMVKLAKGIDPAALKNAGLFGRIRGLLANAREHLVAQYASVERQMDALAIQLEQKAAHHEKRIGDMERMYTDNEAYHGQLEQASLRGEQLLVQLRADFEQAQQIAVHDSFGAQRLADHQRIIDRLSKRVDDLQRAMLLSKQAAPQIRLMQENARGLVQKFGDLKVVALPAWKNSFSLYVLQLEQQDAVKVANAVDEMTDAALRKNADLLRQNTAEIARARQRAVVTVETLEHVQTQLLGSVEDIRRIEDEGRNQRQAEQPKLIAMEQALIAAFVPAKPAA